MYAPHPPELVTLTQRSRIGTQTPETQSPLSSTPNSPRDPTASPFGSTGEDSWDIPLIQSPSKLTTTNSFNHIPNISRDTSRLTNDMDLPPEDAPFDESGTLPPSDARNQTQMGDELMGRQPQRTTSSNRHYQMSTHKNQMSLDNKHGNTQFAFNSSMDDHGENRSNEDSNPPDDDESSQPPSLAMSTSYTTRHPYMEIKQQMAPDSDHAHDPTPSSHPKDHRAIESVNPESQFDALRHALFLQTNSANPSFDDNGDTIDRDDSKRAEKEALMTPVQALRSPPKVQKHAMAWEAHSIDTMSSNDQQVATSTNTAIQQNGQTHENEDTLEKIRISNPSTTLSSMVSPNGDVEYNTHDASTEGEDPSLPSHRVGTAQPSNEASSHGTENMSANNPLSSVEESKTSHQPLVAPFHPQGAVNSSQDHTLIGIQKPQSLAVRSISAPPADLNPDDPHPLMQFTSTISGVVDMAASASAALIGDFLAGANAASCGTLAPPENNTVETEVPAPSAIAALTELSTDTKPIGLSRPRPLSTMTRSVSDMPRHSSAAIFAASGWDKYLQQSPAAAGVSRENTLKKGSVNLSNWLSNSTEATSTKKTDYREITPKKDFQTSEKSAGWLQEEFKRRSNIKKEINDAILARNEEIVAKTEVEPVSEDDPEQEPEIATTTQVEPYNDDFANKLSKALEALPASPTDTTTKADISHHSEVDDEVAAITTTKANDARVHADIPWRVGETNPSQSDEDDEVPKPRRLDYGNSDKEATQAAPTSIDSDLPSSPAPLLQGRTNPVARRVTEVLVSPIVTESKRANVDAKTNGLDNNLHQEMLRFASDTRAALRVTDVPKDGVSRRGDQKLLNSPFRSLDVASSHGENSETKEISVSLHEGVQRPTRVMKVNSRGSETATANSESTGALDMSVTPVLVQSMDSVFGIAKGDITLSLLNENTGQIETSKRATWASRVHGAIWRCRRMRRSMGDFPALSENNQPGSSPHGRSSLPVDLDKARVAGGIKNVQSTQEAALNHLKHDQINDALELFEDIIFAYYSYFERSLQEREENPGAQLGNTTDFKPYIGVALHNLGILKLINGEYTEALSYFGRALENRRACLGEGHRDHVASLVKLAICHYALNEFAEAHSKLEEALVFARSSAREFDDRMQMAEILNNLGCLAYMCGQPDAANTFFRECLDIQFGVLTQSLYVNAPFIGQSISLNVSITRANIGFVKLVTKDLQIAVTALENALMEQQLLLKGANDALIATMDHLAVANLLNGDPQKAAMMFGRILELQQHEYGPHDRRCYVTVDKINMVRSRGTNFEQAVEELRKIFTLPAVSRSPPASASTREETETRAKTPTKQLGQPGSSKGKQPKSTVMKVLTSMRKKKAAQGPS